MQVIDITTQLAFPALVQKLTAAGWDPTPENGPSGESGITVRRSETDALAQILGNFVFTDWQYAYLENCLTKDYAYLTDDEQEYLALMTYHALKNTTEPVAMQTVQSWQTSVSEVLQGLLDEGQTIQLEGVLRFRLRAYLSAVDNMLDETVQHFLADREYEEFVAMLRYMLESQPSTQQVLHVFCSDERVWICDAEGQLVRDADVNQVVVQASLEDDEGMNAEDLAMSILITRSPCQIVIHDLFQGAPWPSFSETLERVFLERASRCGHCTTCEQLQHAAYHLHPYAIKHRLPGQDV